MTRKIIIENIDLMSDSEERALKKYLKHTANVTFIIIDKKTINGD